MATFRITFSETLAKRYEALLHVFRSLASRTPDELAHALADELRLVLDFDLLDAICSTIPRTPNRRFFPARELAGASGLQTSAHQGRLVTVSIPDAYLADPWG